MLAVGGFLLFEGARSPERVGTAAPKGARDGQQAPSAAQTSEGAAGGGSDNLDLGVPVRVELADPRDGERLAVVTTNAAGRAQVERFRVERTIRNILEAPVGSTYAPTAGEREREGIMQSKTHVDFTPSSFASPTRRTCMPYVMHAYRPRKKLVAPAALRPEVNLDSRSKSEV